MRDNTGQNRKSSPLDFFRKGTNYADKAVQDERYAVCTECPMFIPISKQCAKCGCFMHLKVKLLDASCPIDKW